MLEFDIQRSQGSFDLHVKANLGDGITVLLGASGSGKSTLLRCLVGLDPCRGQIDCGSRALLDDMRSVPAHLRPFGVVLQKPLLPLRMPVYEFLAMVAPLEDPLSRPIAERAAHLRSLSTTMFESSEACDPSHPHQVIGALALRPLLLQRLGQLSGGQTQRVLLAAAILRRARWMLLDEPLSALDPNSRQEILTLLATLARRHQISMLYVTHSRAEAIRLSNRILVMNEGRMVHDFCLPISIADKSPLPAKLHDELDVFRGSIIESQISLISRREGLVESYVGEHKIVTPLDRGQCKVGDYLRFFVASSQVMLASQKCEHASALNQLSLRVCAIAPRSKSFLHEVHCDLGGQLLIAELTLRSLKALGIKSGDMVWVYFKAAGVE